MKLYTSPHAPSPRRVRMYAAERGITLELIPVNIATDETHADWFLAVNPLGETPVLVRDDGSQLTESLAICRWLEETQPGPDLFGTTAAERAEINQWVDRLMFRLYVPTTHVFRHGHSFWAGRIPQIAAYADVARAAVLAEYAALDKALEQREWLVRDRISMADIVAFTSVDFGKPSNLRVTPELPHLHRWYEAMRLRPSARA
jgi:glutathione S-transferase